ncbi:hypothetical protein Trydic_g17650 [Trypoxylus dichotomus]
MPKDRELMKVELDQIVLLKSQIRTTLQRYESSGSLTNRLKSGRKCLTTAREYPIIEGIAMRDRTKISRDLSSGLLERHRLSASASTVRKRLVVRDLRGRIAP